MKLISQLKEQLRQERKDAPVDKEMEVAHSDSYMVEILIDNEGVVNLAEQKAMVMHAMSNIEGLEELEGLLCLIDTIQDDLQESHDFKEEYVFPYNHGYTDELDTTNHQKALAALLKAMPLEALPKYLNLDADLDKVLNKIFKEGGCGNT